MEEIRQRYLDVLGRVHSAAERAGRNPADVRLVAVSKTVPAGQVAALQPMAPVLLGENRVQEAQQKQPLLPGRNVFQWHLIGHLQSNKANRAAELFDWIHSVDRRDLLERLEHRCLELGKRLPVLLEVNLAGEESKSGCREEELPSLLETAETLRQVVVSGFMAIPPYCDDPEEVRPFFRRLRVIRDRMQSCCGPSIRLAELSMGMSHDYEVAIEEGATLVRVGTAIFGSR